MTDGVTTLSADVAIIGGGIIGCATAYHLARRGRSVVVLERGLVGGVASGVNFSNLRLQGVPATEMPLALMSQALWEGLEAELGETLEYLREGHVHLALEPAHLPRLEANAAIARAHGVEVMLLDRADTLRRFPFLDPRVQGASWSARDAVVNSRLVTPAFARAVLRLGGRILEQTPVTAVEQRENGFLVTTGAGRPSVTAPVLLNASGAWGGALAAQFGETVPIFPAGPVQIVTEPVPGFARAVLHAVDGSILFRQTARGNVLIAGHPRITVDAASGRTRVPPSKMATNMARLVSLVPHMRAHHVIRTWTGIEGYLPDMVPAVGASGTTPGLFHAFAFSGHGLQLAPAIAVGLAELIVDGGTQIPLAPYALSRFASGVASVHTMAEEFLPDVTVGVDQGSG